MNLVLDSSALITPARIGRLDLLRQLARAVHIPEAVYEEVVLAGQGRQGSVEVAQAQWISRHQVQDQGAVAPLRARVGKGEGELSPSLGWGIRPSCVVKGQPPCGWRRSVLPNESLAPFVVERFQPPVPAVS